MSVEAEGARFALHAPTPVRIDLDAPVYKLLLPFGTARIDVGLGAAAPVRLRARAGDLILAEPESRLAAEPADPVEFLLVTLAPERVRAAAHAAAGPGWRTHDLAPWNDPGVAALGAEMRRALIGDGLPAPAYLAALADALVSRAVIHLADEAPRGLRDPLAPAKLARVLAHIDAGLDGPIAAAELAAVAGLSPAHFARAFARATGDPPHRFIVKRRVCRARDLLADGEASIAVIAHRTGFASQAHLSTAFGREVGTSPARYRAAFRSAGQPTKISAA